jgi:SAM-dependent methyltransferase
MPAAYDRWLVPAVFRPFAIDLACRVSDRAPHRVLELAAGTGALTRELVTTGADVTATDLNTSMVELGSRHVPQARWRQADAMDLPFDDGQFDLVACQFGVMFFPDKPTAFAEVRRVLAPGGTLLMSVWDTLDTHMFQTALVGALERAFPVSPPTFMASVPHGYADVGVITADLRAGGLRRVAVESVTLEGRAESAADLAVGYCTGTPLRAEIEARGDLLATTTAVAQDMQARLGEGPVTGTMMAHVIEATRA